LLSGALRGTGTNATSGPKHSRKNGKLSNSRFKAETTHSIARTFSTLPSFWMLRNESFLIAAQMALDWFETLEVPRGEYFKKALYVSSEGNGIHFQR
jgi:hypothetical protein